MQDAGSEEAAAFERQRRSAASHSWSNRECSRSSVWEKAISATSLANQGSRAPSPCG